MAHPDRWSIVVLAAGQGRRMGGPKALIAAGGRPWWRVQEERLAATGLPRIWVVSAPVALAMAGSGAPIVGGDPKAPMFESVRAGVSAAGEGSGVFVLPVDVPAPGPGVFEALAAAAKSGVAIPEHNGVRGHPVGLSAAWIARCFHPALGGTGELRLDRLIGSAGTVVAVDDPAVVANINTPLELERWLAGER